MEKNKEELLERFVSAFEGLTVGTTQTPSPMEALVMVIGGNPMGLGSSSVAESIQMVAESNERVAESNDSIAASLSEIATEIKNK